MTKVCSYIVFINFRFVPLTWHLIGVAMFHKKIFNFGILMSQALVITGIVLFCIFPFSCKMTETGIQFLSGDYDPPKLSQITVSSNQCVELVFSEKVELEISVIDRQTDNCIESCVYFNEKQNVASICFEEETQIGKDYELFGIVKDEFGNSLTFSVPFKGFNSRVPKLIMTEIQSTSVSSQKKDEKNSGTYRNEFIEFLTLSEGNLSGLEIVSANDGEKRKYVFPNVEVHKGQIFLVHLRNRGNGCIDESTENYNLSFSGYCKNGVMDLWTENQMTVLGNDSDIILLRNSANGEIFDGIMYRKDSLLKWTDDFQKYASLLVENKIYDSDNIQNAFVTTGSTTTKTFQRKDSNIIRDKVLNNEQIEYPVKQFSSSWGIFDETSGSL